MSNRAQLRHMFLDVNFLEDPDMLTIKHRFGYRGIVALLSIYLSIARTKENYLNGKDEVLSIIECYLKSFPEDFFDFLIQRNFLVQEQDNNLNFIYKRNKAISPSERTRFIPEKLRKAVFFQSNGKCHYCDISLNYKSEDPKKDNRAFNIDHIVPFSLGGSSDTDNLVASCRTCNLKKGASHI